MVSHSFFNFLVILSCYIFLSSTPILLNPASALKSCNFPAIFNFGDSNSDTGGLSATLVPTIPPNGETFFHMPVGRFCDGRLIIDFMAESFGLQFLNAYLDSMGSNFTNGANFATTSSTIRIDDNIIPVGSFSPFYLGVQYIQFKEFKSRSKIIRKRGGIYKDLLPKEEYFSKALYTFDIGQNDLGAGFFRNQSIQKVKASVPEIVSNFSMDLKSVYSEGGGRSFWIHNMGPIGCLPYILANFPVTASQMDAAGCAIPYNKVAQYFNQKLKKAVVQLRKELPSAAITYVDIYSVKYLLISQANKHGFEHPLIACCGYGGKYNYSNGVRCGSTVVVNSSQVFVRSCENPSVRVNWDGVHYTDAANKWIFDHIVDGAFSDPPVPLRMACHKHTQ